MSTSVTHVVCDNLAASKVRQLLAQQRASKRSVVRPRWIVDSIDAGRVKGEAAYALVDRNE